MRHFFMRSQFHPLYQTTSYKDIANKARSTLLFCHLPPEVKSLVLAVSVRVKLPHRRSLVRHSASGLHCEQDQTSGAQWTWSCWRSWLRSRWWCTRLRPTVGRLFHINLGWTCSCQCTLKRQLLASYSRFLKYTYIYIYNSLSGAIYSHMFVFSYSKTKKKICVRIFHLDIT